MSVLPYPEAINAQKLQIYNNATFDDAEDPSSAIKDSWVPLQPISLNQSEPPETDSSKENRSPAFCKSPISTESHPPTNRMSQGKPLKLLFKQGLVHPPEPIDPKNIDEEIQQIENEIDRLTSRLAALRIEKSGQDPKTIRRQSVGRIVPAKFMEQKQTPAAKKTEESPASVRRRGLSLGPSEITASVRSIKPENRRKSCFWKLPEIGEEEEEKERKGGRSLSLSPKSRPSARKAVDPRRGISTVGSKKPVKREQSTPTHLQPRTLFGGDRCTASINKAPKNSRIVPSRYGQTTASQTLENDKRRTRGVLSSSSRAPASEIRAKRKWDIPAQARKISPSAILRKGEELPKIRIVRCDNESPRDSGPAKRVADLIGRKSYFDAEEAEVEEEEVESWVRQVLRFEEEEEQ